MLSTQLVFGNRVVSLLYGCDKTVMVHERTDTAKQSSCFYNVENKDLVSYVLCDSMRYTQRITAVLEKFKRTE